MKVPQQESAANGSSVIARNSRKLRAADWMPQGSRTRPSPGPQADDVRDSFFHGTPGRLRDHPDRKAPDTPQTSVRQGIRYRHLGEALHRSGQEQQNKDEIDRHDHQTHRAFLSNGEITSP